LSAYQDFIADSPVCGAGNCAYATAVFVGGIVYDGIGIQVFNFDECVGGGCSILVSNDDVDDGERRQLSADLSAGGKHKNYRQDQQAPH